MEFKLYETIQPVGGMLWRRAAEADELTHLRRSDIFPYSSGGQRLRNCDAVVIAVFRAV